MPDPNKIGTLDLEALKDKTSLSEEDIAAIGQSVLDDEKPEPKDEEKKDTEPKDEGTPDSDKDKETSESLKEEKAKEEAAKKEEEKSEEDKAKEAEVTKKAFEEELAVYAKESEMTVEEARKDLESIGKIQEKYKNDPKQLAKANLHLQRFYTKTQEELKEIKEAKAALPPQQITHDTIVKLIDDGKLNVKGKAATREDVITAYREQEPDLTETIDDEGVLKLAAKAIKEGFIAQQREHTALQATQAKEKMSKLISDLSEEDKQYLPDIKPILDLQKDATVMKESFNLNDFVLWAKGKKYDTALKESEEKGYKRGLEEAKILGEKKPGSGGKPPVDTKSKRTLSSEEKQRAYEMFDNLGLTEAQMIDSYIEVLEAEKKKK